jgi:hypothetical protein
MFSAVIVLDPGDLVRCPGEPSHAVQWASHLPWLLLVKRLAQQVCHEGRHGVV